MPGISAFIRDCGSVANVYLAMKRPRDDKTEFWKPEDYQVGRTANNFYNYEHTERQLIVNHMLDGQLSIEAKVEDGTMHDLHGGRLFVWTRGNPCVVPHRDNGNICCMKWYENVVRPLLDRNCLVCFSEIYSSEIKDDSGKTNELYQKTDVLDKIQIHCPFLLCDIRRNLELPGLGRFIYSSFASNIDWTLLEPTKQKMLLNDDFVLYGYLINLSKKNIWELSLEIQNRLKGCKYNSILHKYLIERYVLRDYDNELQKLKKENETVLTLKDKCTHDTTEYKNLIKESKEINTKLRNLKAERKKADPYKKLFNHKNLDFAGIIRCKTTFNDFLNALDFDKDDHLYVVETMLNYKNDTLFDYTCSIGKYIEELLEPIFSYFRYIKSHESLNKKKLNDVCSSYKEKKITQTIESIGKIAHKYTGTNDVENQLKELRIFYHIRELQKRLQLGDSDLSKKDDLCHYFFDLEKNMNNIIMKAILSKHEQNLRYLETSRQFYRMTGDKPIHTFNWEDVFTTCDIDRFYYVQQFLGCNIDYMFHPAVEKIFNNPFEVYRGVPMDGHIDNKNMRYSEYRKLVVVDQYTQPYDNGTSSQIPSLIPVTNQIVTSSTQTPVMDAKPIPIKPLQPVLSVFLPTPNKVIKFSQTPETDAKPMQIIPVLSTQTHEMETKHMEIRQFNPVHMHMVKPIPIQRIEEKHIIQIQSLIVDKKTEPVEKK